MTTSVYYDKPAIKFLKALDKPIAQRLEKKITSTLETSPVPSAAKSIVGHHDTFRLRVGRYRALYRVDHAHSRVIVVKIAKRPRVYRR